ncbi:retrovirus-related pol polyprotein from transposon TNT 1-94 [Tanacetum coccineum]
MAAVEAPQTLEYRGGQLNAAPILEVENFTNWKKRFMCHIIGIEPQFKNIIKNSPFIPMVAGQKNPGGQWTTDERKAANLDQRLKSLIMSVLPNDQINSVINCLTAKSTWDDLILYHEGPSDIKESRVMDQKLCYNTFKFKEGESLTQTFTRYKSLMNELVNDGIKLLKLEINTGFINRLLKKWLSFCQSLRNTNHVKDSERFSIWTFKIVLMMERIQEAVMDEEEVPSDDNEMVKVKVLMALAEDNDVVSKEGARNGEWVNILMRKLTAITETWLNSSNKVNWCISEQIPPPKKRILGVDQLTEDPSSSGQKDLVFVKSLANDTKVSIPGVERPWLSKAEGFILPNHDTGRILPAESQRNTTDPSVAVTDSLATNYDFTNEFSVYSTPLPPLKKLDDVEPISGPKTIKSKLRSKSTFKAETLKGVIINEPSSTLAKDNKSSSASKVNSAPAGKLKSVKIEDDPPLAIIIKELNNLKLQFSTSQSSYSRRLKVVFENDSTCTTEGYGSINVMFDEKRGTIFNSNKEVVMIAPRGNHHRASFKTKKTSSIKKCLHLLHMDLFRPVTPRSINHEKYTLVIVDEYSRYTWVYFLKKKSQALETIMSSIKRVENQNDIKVKQLRTDNVYVHNHKDHLGKFDEKADDGYLLGYSLVSKAFRVLNTRRQQTKETYHITFDEIPDAIKFLKPSVDNINIAENERYPLDKYLHHYEPSQRGYFSPRYNFNPKSTLTYSISGARMLTRAMAKQLSAASAHECLFVDFHSEEEPKKVSEALKHPG